MTVSEMIEKNPQREICPPESIFEVKSDSGEKMLMCYASFVYQPELDAILKNHPRLFSYEVVKENFTKEELDERRKIKGEYPLATRNIE